MYKRFGRCVPPSLGSARGAVGREKWTIEVPFFCPVLASGAVKFHSLSHVLAVILAVTMVLTVKTAPRIRATAQ
jgi:hypothetical protein